MDFRKGSNTFVFGKIKLGTNNINKIYFGSNYIWPGVEAASCATEGICSYVPPVSSCATEGSCIRL